MLRWLCDKIRGEKEESEISTGMLFATGLVAGGTLTGVAQRGPQGDPARRTARLGRADEAASTSARASKTAIKDSINLDLFGLIFYVILGFILVRVALKKPRRGAAKP